MAASSSAARSTRPSLVARTGSEAASSRPMIVKSDLEQPSRVGRDAHRYPVGAGVHVGRRRVVGDVAGALANDPEVAVLREDPLEHREERLGQRDVHHLPSAGGLSLVEGDQASDHRLQRRDRVAQAEPHPRGWAVRFPGDEAQSAGRLGNRPERRLIAQGPRLAVPRDPHHDEAGIGPIRSSGSRFHGSSRPGRKFSMRMSLSVGELADEVLVGRVMEVGRHRQLAPRLDEVPQRVGAVPRHPPLPERVSPVRDARS